MHQLTYNLRGGIHADGLKNLCDDTYKILGDNLQIVEIGSYCGASSSIIATKFINSNINCVDPWSPYTEDCSIIDLAKQELELKEAEMLFDIVVSKNTNIKKNKMSSVEYCQLILNSSIDFIYIDGNHQYSSVKEDILTWLPKIKVGGIIAGHDYTWDSVKIAITEIFNKNPNKTYCDSSWMYQL
jgi:predicted O-methyltransferase YrrM